MFHRGRNKRDLRDIISKASNFKERATFRSRIKTIVSLKFSRITKVISEQKISPVTDVYVTADLYQAKRQDKLRIVCRFKINMLLRVPGGGWGGENSHMKGAGMLVVSLRGVNFRFWSHLGCSEENVIILSCKGLF